MNASVFVAVPPAVVTEILFAPTLDPTGVTAVIAVALTTVKLAASTEFTFTLDAPRKLVPVMVIVVPPDCGPEVGLTEAMVGGAVV